MPTNTNQTELERIDQEFEGILLAVIRPYTNDFKVFNEETAKYEPGEKISITDGIKLLHEKLKEAEKRGRGDGIVSMTKKIRPILRWLFGYTDFPMRKDGEGAYWWRTYLREKLKKNGLYHLSPLLTDKIK